MSSQFHIHSDQAQTQTELVATTYPSRVVIEGISPQVDGGRFPIKRIAGEEVVVRAITRRPATSPEVFTSRVRSESDLIKVTRSVAAIMERTLRHFVDFGNVF